ARHKVTPGKVALFEKWQGGISEACLAFPGYLGTEVIRPVGGSHDFVVIFRYDTYEHLESWMSSAVRAEWIARTSEFSEEPPRVDFHSLEFWFSPERHQGRAPARYKMALVTFAVIWPLVHFVPRLVSDRLGGASLVSEVTSVGIIVLLMTYVVMPTATWALRPLLYDS
ncbi:MAG: antibiotic biosynthesis monooxygenase, partial [Deltaproteobacteria bacterium]|nr:antibiotic biosynthesis monooxygenase [Deltaproteobacteria bacterium]